MGFVMVLKRLGRRLRSIVSKIFRKKKDVRIGLYGPVNSGKTTLANKMCLDWLGEEMGAASVIPHETREIQTKEKVTIKNDGKSLSFNLVDTPGIATKIDFEDFIKYGMKNKAAKQRAREATKGVIEAIKWLDNVDMVLVVLDSAMDPLDQVNITILGNLDARKIPFVIVANKVDLKRSQANRVREAFPNYNTIGISAKTGFNVEELYGHLIEKL
jgi:small GTP-binding protein